MKSMSQVFKLSQCPETMEEAASIIDSLEADRSALRRDKARLDWLIKECYDHKNCDSSEAVYMSALRGIKDVRAAIDSAMKGANP